MAGTTVNIDLKLGTTGMDAGVEKSKAIRDNLTAGAATMGKVSAGTTGSRAVSEKAAGQTYAAQRGVAGATGASARDFAAESQGLGGLVRLYATVAANTYAAAAAFTALSKAMDTTNMIKGLDQLGAASGRNLGSLSKQLAQASEGAINLRDAAQAVAQASAAGLGGAQILELGDIAKKASQALGVSMPDALSRISRGVVKLEPELLDELGIFTKIDEASRKYALSLGKSVTALTDFEKRQGFANAVAEEGKRKFDSIKLDVNPYDKLLASFQNLVQSGLELVNKVLGPIVKTLSESPVALAAVLALIAKTLIGSAIPAIGQYRKSLEDQAEAATRALETTKELRYAHKQYIDTVTVEIATERDRVAAVKAGIAVDNLAKAQRVSLGTQRVLAKLPDVTKTLDEAQVISVKERILELNKQTEDLEKRTAPRTAANRAAEIALNKALVIELKARVKEAEELNKLEATPRRVGGPSVISQEAKQIRDLKAATSKSTSISILQDVSKTIDSSSIADAYKSLTRGISESSDKLTTFGKAATYVRGVGSILTGVVMGVASALSTVSIAVTIALAAFAALDFLFSKNAKTAEESSVAYDALTSSLENANRTLELISKKDPLAQFNTESISAISTAFDELTLNMQNSFEKMKANLAMMSWFDEIKNGIKGIFNQDEISKNSKQFALSINKALQLATPGTAKTKTVESLTKLLGVNPEELKAVSQIDFTFKTQEQAQAQLKELGKALLAAKGTAQEVDAAFKSFNKTFDEILISAVPTDPMAKLGQETIKSAKAMTAALADPAQALTKLAELSKDTASLRVFDTKTGTELARNSDLINALANSVKTYEARIVSVTAEEKNLLDARAKTPRRGGTRGETLRTQEQALIDNTLQTIAGERKSLQILKASSEASLKPFQDLAVKGVTTAAERGAKLIDDAIAQGFARASITVASAYATALGDTKAGAELRGKLEKQSIDLQIAQLVAQSGLIDSQVALRNAIEENTITIKQESIKASTTLTPDVKKAQLEVLSARETALRAAPTTDAEAQAKKARNAKISELTAQKRAIDIRTGTEVSGIAVSDAKDLLDTEIARLKTQQQLNQLQQQGLAYLSEETVKKNDTLSFDIRAKQLAKELLDINTRIANQEIIAAKLKTPETARSIQELKARQKLLLDRQAASTTAVVAEDLAKAQANAKALKDAELSRAKLVFDTESSNENTLFTLREENLTKLNRLGTLSPEAQAQAQADLDIEKEKARTKSATFELEQQQVSKLFALEQTLKKQTEGTDEYAQTKQLYDLTAKYYSTVIGNESILSQSKQATLTATAATTIELAKQKTVMDQLVLTTESLAAVFGEIGTAIGTAAQAMQRSADSEAQNLTARIALQAEYTKAQQIEDPQDRQAAEATAIKNLAEQDKKSTKDKLNNDIAVVNSTKKLFKEKTGAYKVLAATEKVMHITKLATSLKEMVFDKAMLAWNLAADAARVVSGWFVTEQKVAQGTVQATAAAAPAAAEAVKDTPGPAWVKIAAGLATLAFVLSLVKGGGGGGVSTAGMTSADRQGTGAGETWKDGKKIETGGGVFGDPTAKSDSIVKSIEILNATQVEGLSYNNKMVQLLTSINQSIGKAATGIYGTVGLAKGSLFGTEEGTKGSSILGGLWGKSTTKEILDSGIKFTGTFKDVMDNVKDSIQGFETVKNTVTKKRFWSSSSSSSISNDAKELDASLSEAISGIFDNAGELFVESGTKLGMTAESVIAKLGTIDVDKFASLRGLKGTELETEFNNIISGILDDTARQLFTQFDTPEFKKFGEGMLQTVTRVVDTNEKVNLSLISMGVSALNAKNDITPATAGITEAMANAAGGLDKFLENTKFFVDNFLTEAERLAPITAQVTTDMATIVSGAMGAGFIIPDATGLIDTKVEFAALYKVLSGSTTPAAIELRHQMDLIAPSFLRAVEQLEDMFKQVADINTESATKYLSEADKLIYTRAQERKEITETNTGLFDLITTLKLASLELDKATQELLDGYKAATVEADNAKSALMNVAKQGLTTLEAEANAAKNELTALAKQGLSILTAEADAAKSELVALAREGLSILTAEADAAKSELVALAREGLGLLTTKLSNLQSSLESLNSSGFNTLKSAVDTVKDSIKASYKSAVETQKSATKAYIDNLKTVSKGIKEFLGTVSLGDLGTEADKVKVLRAEFNKTLAAARAGNDVALNKLPQISQDLLAAAREQSSSKVEYARTFAEVTTQLTDISSVLDAKVQTAEASAAEGVLALETSTLSTAEALDLANTELAKWTKTIKATGLEIDLKLEEDTVIKLATADGALAALDEATTSLNAWLVLIGKDAADILTKTDPTTLVQLTSAFDDLKAKIGTVNVDIASYIDNTNQMLKDAKIGEADLLQANTTVTESTLKSQIAETQTKLDTANAAIDAYIATTNAQLTAAKVGEADMLSPNTVITKDNIAAKIAETQTKLDTANAAIDAYINTTNAQLTAAKVGETDMLKPNTVITKDNIAAQITLTQTKLNAANTVIATYIADTNRTLTAAGFGEADMLKPTEVQVVKDAVAAASAKYTVAVANVGTWATTLGNLGIAFTPYGTDDTKLSSLTGKFNTAKAAFTTANAAVASWIDNITGFVNNIKPTSPVTAAVATATVETSNAKMDLISKYFDDLRVYNVKLAQYKAAEAGNMVMGPHDSGWQWAPLSYGPPTAPTIPKLATGTNYVPQDMLAMLHQGEAVIPKPYNDTANKELVAEIRELRAEVAKLRVVSAQNEYNTRKTKEVLQLVTVGGEYMQTKAT